MHVLRYTCIKRRERYRVISINARISGTLTCAYHPRGRPPVLSTSGHHPPRLYDTRAYQDNSGRFQAALVLEAGTDPAEREEDQEHERHRQTIQAEGADMHVDIEQDTNRTCTHSNSGGAVGWMVGQTTKCPGIDPQGQMAWSKMATTGCICTHVHACLCCLCLFMFIVMLRFRFVVLQTETQRNLFQRRYG